MKLTATQVKHSQPREKPYKLSDGKGLYLLVNPNGSKYWRLKYRYGGREKLLSIGVYPDKSLADARDDRDEARKLLARNLDPGAIKRLRKQASRDSADNTFQAVALEWFETRMSDKSDSYRDRTMRLLRNDLFPALGNLPIDDIEPPELLKALRKIESRGAVDMAHRAKQAAGQVFRFGVATGRCQRDSSADLRGVLKSRAKTHYAAITDPQDVGSLLLAIDGYAGSPVVKVALQLSPLLFQRPGEIRAMEWSEVDWNDAQWLLPAEKMKMRQPHIVPLAAQALELLRDLEKHTASRGKFVFPSQRGASRPLSDNGVRTALRTLGYENSMMTPHGFRAMARTLLDEELGYRVDYIEHQLAHAVRDPNGRAYNRTTHLRERRAMMQGWADYLDVLKARAATASLVAGS